MAAQLHFISGKGGVGKSSLAAALAAELSARGENTLLIDVQGSGHALRLLGIEDNSFEPRGSPLFDNLWACRILPRETFRQYFGNLLTLGDSPSLFAQATAGMRERLVDLVLENRAVSAFVDVCPGLEPVVLMGKIHWECTQAKVPESKSAWQHVVVDAPATGHGASMLRSTQGLTEVFPSGLIHRQCTEIMNYLRDPTYCRLHVVTLAEELPLQEALELGKQLRALQVTPKAWLINRAVGKIGDLGAACERLPPVWRREAQLERERSHEQAQLKEEFAKQAQQLSPPTQLLEVGEFANADETQLLKSLRAACRELAL